PAASPHCGRPTSCWQAAAGSRWSPASRQLARSGSSLASSISNRLVMRPVLWTRCVIRTTKWRPLGDRENHFPPSHDRPKWALAPVFHAVLRIPNAAGRIITGRAQRLVERAPFRRRNALLQPAEIQRNWRAGTDEG